MVIEKSARNLKIFIALFLIILLSAGAYFFIFNNKDNNEQDSIEVSLENTPCSVREKDSILSEAASVFLTSNSLDQKNNEQGKKIIALEKRIKEQKNYLNDANCLHIMAMVSINKSNSAEAEKYVGLLGSEIENNNPDSYILDENVNFLSIEDMRKAIEAIKFNAEQLKINNPYGNQSRLDEKINQ